MVGDRHGTLAIEYVWVNAEIRAGADVDDTNIGDLVNEVDDLLRATDLSVEDKIDFLSLCCEYAQSDEHVLAIVAAGPVEDFLNANATVETLGVLEAGARRAAGILPG